MEDELLFVYPDHKDIIQRYFENGDPGNRIFILLFYLRVNSRQHHSLPSALNIDIIDETRKRYEFKADKPSTIRVDAYEKTDIQPHPRPPYVPPKIEQARRILHYIKTHPDVTEDELSQLL
jgi:hypothetical protein